MSLCASLREWMSGGGHLPHAGATGPGPRNDERVFSRHALAHGFLSAVVVASAVELLEGGLLPIELPAFVMASSVAQPYDRSGTHDPLLSSIALVKIDEKRFGDANLYAGRSPLRRCTLLRDLSQLLALDGIETVAVDLSLAPPVYLTPRDGAAGDAQKNSEEFKKEVCCQAAIDALLDANPGRMVVIEPLDSTNVTQHIWMDARKAKGVRFARSELDAEYGLVRGYRRSPEDVGPPLLGEHLAHSACRAANMPPSPTCRGFDAQDATLSARPPREVDYAISMRALQGLHAHGDPLPLDDACLVSTGSTLPRSDDCRRIKHLLFGAVYSRDDEFLTPVGPVPGMVVHAAIAARPRHLHNKALGFALDIVIGTLVFAPLIKWCWSGYFGQAVAVAARPDTGPRPADPELAWLWLLGLVIAAAALLTALTLASVGLYARCGAWISPVPMSVGMAIDAFVIQGVETAQQHLEEARRGPAADAPEPPAAPGASVWRRLARVAPCLAGIAVVAGALVHLAPQVL